MSYVHLLPALNQLAIDAGAEIMRHRAAGIDVQIKPDSSPVTAADEAADRLICDALTQQIAPEITVISEEGATDFAGAAPEIFWLVDPLDGTKNFIRGGDEFTVNIALIVERTPVLGVIYIPAQAVLYYGAAGHGAYKQEDGQGAQPIHCRALPETGGVAVMSRHHGSPVEQEICARYGVTEYLSASSSLKFCSLAEGRADLYPRSGRTMEWDIAAGHAILRAAGGDVYPIESPGISFAYAKPAFENGGFIGVGSPHD